jgi:hypothetical protein
MLSPNANAKNKKTFIKLESEKKNYWLLDGLVCSENSDVLTLKVF